MRYPKTAIIFEGIVDSGVDGCKIGQLYEFSSPGWGDAESAVIWAVDPFGGEQDVMQFALYVKNLKPVTPGAKELLKNLPRRIGGGITSDEFPVSVE